MHRQQCSVLRIRPYRPRLEILEDRNLLSMFTVDHLADDMVGDGLNGSLRYCITNAANGDDIQVSVQGTINLTGALPNLTHSISIEGPGPDQLTVRRDVGGFYRILTVASRTTVAIAGLTISNGTAVLGGGIYNAGTLTLTNSTVSGNEGSSGGGSGGGIYNASGGTLTLTNSTVSWNGPTSVGGGIYNAGTLTLTNSTVSLNGASGAAGIENFRGTVTIGNSTIARNSAEEYWNGAFGGGIDNYQGTMNISNSTIAGNSVTGGDDGAGGGGIDNRQGTMTISDCTIAGNSAMVFNGSGFGGGIYNSAGTLHVGNTIIGGNTASFFGPDLVGNLGSQGHNLIGNTEGGSGFDPTDLLNVDPMLGPLQDNGGPTFTMALLPGSPAIDAGDNIDAPDWDQRGEGFPRIVNDIIDIGAFEYQGGGGSPGRTTPPCGEAFRLDVAALLSPAAPNRTSFFSLIPPLVPAKGAWPGPDVAVLDRLFASLNKWDAGLDLSQPMRQAPAEADSWALDPASGDGPLLV
jgi:hypothetical protein